jgi:hypothetical protein
MNRSNVGYPETCPRRESTHCGPSATSLQGLQAQEIAEDIDKCLFIYEVRLPAERASSVH